MREPESVGSHKKWEPPHNSFNHPLTKNVEKGIKNVWKCHKTSRYVI